MDKYLNIIDNFIIKMNYRDNKHYLGTYFYGSSFTGFNTKYSDIDLHVIFDNSDLEHIYRGICYIDGIKIEYFEKCINDVYLSVENDIDEGNYSWYPMIGNSMIIEDKDNKLKKLQNYTKEIYQKGIPKLDEQDIMEKISIINNRMNKLQIMALEDNPSFYSLYYITIEKIRRFYHSIHGFPKINTSKISKVYKDNDYLKSFYDKEFVSDNFKEKYLTLIETTNRNKIELLNELNEFYKYVKNGRELSEEYRIKIKTRNKK